MGKVRTVHMADPKQCTKCTEFKPRTEFYPHSVSRNGVSSWCRVCTNRIASENQKRDKDKVKIRNRKSKLKRAFGITLEQYDCMLDAQDHKCQICGTDSPGGHGRFVVDHDHKSGSIRALLCNLCNVGLGALGENPALLRKAADYLESHNE